MFKHALTRGISANFSDATVMLSLVEPIDVALAVRQHGVYVEALRELGLETTELAPAEAFPDGCFVEDCAVLVDGVALITRPGTPSRRGEEATIAGALAGSHRIATMEAPATLEGGDCMRIGQRIFVGRSSRTNEAGIRRLAEVFAPQGIEVVPVRVPEGTLHLKCVCSPLPGDQVLLAEGTIPSGSFPGLEVHLIPMEEAYAGNCVAVGNTAIIPGGFPRTRMVLEAAGFNTMLLDLSEIRKADGSLTCLSLIW